MSLEEITMSYLSDDVVLNIFSFLDKKGLCLASRVCQRWRRIAYDKTLWKELNLRRTVKCRDSADFLDKLIPNRLLSLRIVNFGGLQIKYITLKNMFMKCKKLETIILGRGSKLQKPPSRRRHIIIPSGVQTLDLRLTSGDFEFLLANGPHFNSLINLGIGRDSYSPQFFPHLFCQAINLKVLDLTNCYNLVDDQLYDVFNRCILLESLCIIGCRKLVGKFFPNMIRNCKKLKTLLIRYTPVTDEVLCSCEWELLPLEELDISACPEFTWFGLSILVGKLHHIRYLNMSYCGIGHAVTDAVLQQLLARGIASRIEMLDIRWSFLVTAETLTAFLANCKQLRYLGVYQSSVVTSNVISEAARYLPELRTIEFGGLHQEILTASQMLCSLREHCKNLSTVSLINFCTIDISCDERQFSDLTHHAKKLQRINLCDCTDALIIAARNGVMDSSVSVTDRWECALPPPVHTLDFVTRCSD